MSVQIVETKDPKFLEVHLTGKLAKEDYSHFVPAVESHLKADGKLRLLVEMHDFHGWTGAALWEDVKFDARHFKDFERIAMVGESKWQHGMAAFCKPFTSAKLRYFDHADMDEARQWLEKD